MKDEKHLIQDISNHLDQSVDELDPKIISKLTRARHAALDAKKSTWTSWKIPITSMAGTAALILIAFSLFRTPAPDIQTHQLEIVEILTSEQNLDLYENLEFYTWLAENPQEDLGS